MDISVPNAVLGRPLEQAIFWPVQYQIFDMGGGKLVLFGVRPELHSTLRLLSFDKFLTIKPDQAAALAALPQ